MYVAYAIFIITITHGLIKEYESDANSLTSDFFLFLRLRSSRPRYLHK